MTVTSGSVVIKKDQTNLIGISIGGGAPYCPCLYIVQVYLVNVSGEKGPPVFGPSRPSERIINITVFRFSMERRRPEKAHCKVATSCWASTDKRSREKQKWL